MAHGARRCNIDGCVEKVARANLLLWGRGFVCACVWRGPYGAIRCVLLAADDYFSGPRSMLIGTGCGWFIAAARPQLFVQVGWMYAEYWRELWLNAVTIFSRTWGVMDDWIFTISRWNLRNGSIVSCIKLMYLLLIIVQKCSLHRENQGRIEFSFSNLNWNLVFLTTILTSCAVIIVN